MAGVTTAEEWATPWWTYALIGAAWFAGIYALEAMGIGGRNAFYAVAGTAIVSFGALCLYNARECGALHCKINGPGFLVVGALSWLSLTGIATVNPDWIMILFLIVLAAGVLTEWIVELRRENRAA